MSGEAADGPRPEAARIRRSWDANADGWTSAVRGGHIASRKAATDDAVVSAVLALEPRRVLDVGCGEGWLARELAKRGVDVLGIDGSRGLVDEARAIPGGAAYRVCSYEELIADPERIGGGYDAVVCNFSLLDSELAPLLSALRKRLSGDGALVIQTVHPWSARGEGYRDGWRTETFAPLEAVGDFPEPMPWYFRTLESWLRELGSAGLTVTAIQEPLDPGTGEPLSMLITARTLR